MDPVVEALSEGKWQIRVERAHGERTSSGQVVVRQESEPRTDTGPFLPLAGARAWLALSLDLLQAEDAEGALEAVQAGLEELGEHDYSASMRVLDDTTLHIDLAQELSEEGKTAEAAERFARALETRLDLYARLHAEDLAG